MTGRARRIDKTLAFWPDPMPVENRMRQPTVTIDVDAASDLRHMFFDPSMEDRLGQIDMILATRAIREVMSWGVVSVGPPTRIREAARTMFERRIDPPPWWRPLALSPSITFEQRYEEVDGNSASRAELLALLSSLASISLS